MSQDSAKAKSLTGLLQGGDSYMDNENSLWLKESGNLSPFAVFPFSNEHHDPFICRGLNQLWTVTVRKKPLSLRTSYYIVDCCGFSGTFL